MSEPISRVDIPGQASRMVAFGGAELERALATHRVGGFADIHLRLADDLSGSERSALGLSTGPESYAIGRDDRGTLILVGTDDVGLMYACLDLAEQLQMASQPLGPDDIHFGAHAPELATRGIYTFLHNSQAEAGWLYEPAYWHDYADELARCRYNRFNLIYGHQSPHLIPIYAHLLDELDDAYPQIRVDGITSDERARNLAALQMASQSMAERGLRFFLGIWQSRPWTIANGVWEDQPTQVSGTDDLPLLTRYTRDGFLRLMARCPHIGGIQLRMNIESGVGDQRFFVDAFVPALVELANKGRRLQVELRNWGLHPETVEAFRATGLEIIVSAKYFAEYQAMPYQPPIMRGSYSYDSYLRQDKPFPFQWHVWNLGSHRLFNWGDPSYARRFVQSCHLGDGVGFEVTPPGSQKGFSQWGQVEPGDWPIRRSASDVGGDQPGFRRYWFFHHAFGRLSYDPTTRDDVFRWQLAQRSTPEAAPILLDAYKSASKVVSYLISQRMDDKNMYCWPELDCGGPIDHYMLAPPGEETLFKTAWEYATDEVRGRYSAKLSPFAAARDLETMADQIESALRRLDGLPDLGELPEVATCRADFGALAAMTRYHSAKCRAAGNLALFYVSGDASRLDVAEEMAQSAVVLWDRLCVANEVYYARLHLGPTGGHWRDNMRRVAYDLQRVRQVRAYFDRYGLMAYGFDLGPLEDDLPANLRSGLRPEPRFVGVDGNCAYSHDQGYGWLSTAGLRTVGTQPLDRDLLWGVFSVRPEQPFDDDLIDALPTTTLEESYVTGVAPHIFRVDLPDGDYRLTMRMPATAGLTTPVRVGEQTFELGSVGRRSLSAETRISGGVLTIAVGGFGAWALSAIIVCYDGPLIAHLPRRAIRREQGHRIQATVTGVDRPESVALRFRVRNEWFEVPMTGNGRVFDASLALDGVVSPLDYEIVARARDGHVMRRMESVPIVDGFQAPAAVALTTADVWACGQPYVVAIDLDHGEFAHCVRLYYREADQNRDWRVIEQLAGRSGSYRFEIDTADLDDAYELLSYIEICDVLGGGSFAPDPFTDARYRIAKPS